MRRRKKEKNYFLDIEIKFSQIMPATSKKEAIQKTKDSFSEEYNLMLCDDEIKRVETR